MERSVLSLTFFISVMTSCVLAQGELNEPCTLVTHCRDFGYYCGQNRTCQCLMGYIPNKYQDKCVGIIDKKCKYDEHCVEGAFCMAQSICKCKDHLEPTSDFTKCSHSRRVTPEQFIIMPVLILVYLKFCLWLP
ncbi:hypothetical protein JTB14_032432 [Gonioctena quinquepunctata]|nr:hypothetical protein JTB14_032432 [Gonioctena quinquepunctata]